MVTYQFEVDDETWQAWKRTVPRHKTLDERLIELIEADTEGETPPTAEDSSERRESDSSPEPMDSLGDTERRDEAASLEPGSRADTGGGRDDGLRAPSEIDEAVWAVVDEVAAGWDDDDRLEARRNAAALALQHAVDTEGYVGRSDEAIQRIREQWPVAGQDDETWWRQNVRAVLQEVGDYSKGHHGYHVDELGKEGGPYDPTDEF